MDKRKGGTEYMKKKVLAVLSAMMVLTMGTLTVSAASPTTSTAEAAASGQTATTSVKVLATAAEYAAATTADAGYDVAAVSDTIVSAATVAAQNNLLNDVAATGKLLNNSTLTQAAADPSKKVTAELLTVVEVNPASAEKDANGNYVVTLKHTDIKSGDMIAVLHYNGTSWDTIAPDSVASGKMTFATPSLSPISIVKLDVTDVKAAPKTGNAVPAAMFVVLIGIAGAAVCGKKYFA